MAGLRNYRARLIAARDRAGLTPRLMAARLLTPRQTYAAWEAGKRRTPGAAVVAAESLRTGDDSYHRLVTAAADLSRAGASQAAIARKLSISRGLVTNMVRRGEIPPTAARPTGRRGFGADDQQRADQILRSGSSIAATAEMIGCSTALIHHWIRDGIIAPSQFRPGDTTGQRGRLTPVSATIKRRRKRVVLQTEALDP